jgi:hypothetical protein
MKVKMVIVFITGDSIVFYEEKEKAYDLAEVITQRGFSGDDIENDELRKIYYPLHMIQEVQVYERENREGEEETTRATDS